MQRAAPNVLLRSAIRVLLVDAASASTCCFSAWVRVLPCPMVQGTSWSPRHSAGFVLWFSTLVAASAMLAVVSVWASVLCGVGAVVVLLVRIQAARRARVTGLRPDPAGVKRRIRATALAFLGCAILSGASMYAAEPDNPGMPAWLRVGAPLFFIVLAGYAWWAGGFLERHLRRQASDGPNPGDSR